MAPKKLPQQTQLVTLPRGGRVASSPPRHPSYLSAAQTPPAPPIPTPTTKPKRKSESHDMESDDASVQTTTTDNKTSPTSTNPKEYVLKFSFHPRHPTDHKSIAITHFAILKLMKSLFPTLKIFDNHGETIRDLSTFHSSEDYASHFDLHFRKGNAQKRRDPSYSVYHRIHTPVSLRDIKQHRKIQNLLKHHNARMTMHAWQEDEYDIVNLGFFLNVDPTNFLCEEFEESVRSTIAFKTHRNKQNIPRFKCRFTSPSHTDELGNRSSTKSYDIQVRMSQSKEMISLLQRTYADDPVFIFHRIRHSDPHLYRRTIQQQNIYLSHSRVVPIQGIDARTMFYLEPKLHNIAGIHAVHRHRKTDTEGRWSIITTDAQFTAVRKTLAEQLSSLTTSCCDEVGHSIDLALPPVGLAFKQPINDSESTGSFETYLSACATIYSNITMDEFPDTPPESFANVPQEWDITIPTDEQSLLNTPVSITTQPHPAPTARQPTYQQLQTTNAALIATITELQQQVKFLMGQTRQKDDSSSSHQLQTRESAHATANMSLDSAFSSMSNEFE